MTYFLRCPSQFCESRSEKSRDTGGKSRDGKKVVGTGTGRDGNGKPRGFLFSTAIDCPTLPVVGFVFLHHDMTMDATVAIYFLSYQVSVLFFLFFFPPANLEQEDFFLKEVGRLHRARLAASKVEKILFLRLNKSRTKFLDYGRLPGSFASLEGGARRSC